MAKKVVPRVIEVKTVVLANGETAQVKVYAPVAEEKKTSISFKHAKQTNDFSLVGNWKRNSTAQG